MFIGIRAFLFVGLCLSSVCCMSLPDYIPICKRNDPDLNACALQAARASIHTFSLGDSSRNWQPLDPLFVNELRVSIGPGEDAIKIVFNDNIFTGISMLELTNIKFDLDKKMITAEGLVNLDVKSVYVLSGKILFIPLSGNGDASIKLKNTTLHIRYWYEHVEGPDGMTHWNIVKDELKYEVGRAIFRLENLLNAEKRIGDQINNLLNQLWREIVADVGPSISKALSKPVMENLKALLEQVPYDVFMPPE